MQVPWRESASLILAAGKPLKILLLQRGSRGSFKKNHVFPGGVVHADDFSPKWTTLLTAAAQSHVLIPPGAARAPCLLTKPGEIAREIGFRLTAIRETFEESGILLAQPSSALAAMRDTLSSWRKRVLEDGGLFYEMCKVNGIYPDITALKLWSDWLTPLGLKGNRFDTVFFVAEGDETARVELSEDEMVGFEWTSPMKALGAAMSGSVRMAPPQVYEFSRLLPFEGAKDLLRFAAEREKFGCELIFPVRIRTPDGIVGLLPGDDAYPAQPDLLGEQPHLTSHLTIDQLRSGVRNLHRVEGDLTDRVKAFQFNINLQPAHCNPVTASAEVFQSARKKVPS